MKHKLILRLFILALVCVFSFSACNKSSEPAPAAFDAAAHSAEIQNWQSTRLASLTKDDGWLTLIGLFWLNEGENKFGSGEGNPVLLPKEKSPAVAGSLWLEKGAVRLAVRPGVSITADGKAVTTLDLKDDNADGGPTILHYGSLLLNIVKRGERIGVRVKDTESRSRREFKGLEFYPVSAKWRVEARFEPYQPPKTIPITNVLSMTEDQTSPGALAFDVDGKTYRIDPILEKGETDLFVMVADGTTGGETYGAGRYIYVSPPDASGKVIIDFNKAYSPPCAFTNYATCPLPPRQNYLPFRIDAGEKKYTGTIH